MNGAGWRQRAHITSGEAGRLPPFLHWVREPEGWALRPGAVSGGWSSRPDSDVVPEMPDAGSCLPLVMSLPGTTSLGHGSGEVSTSRVLLV